VGECGHFQGAGVLPGLVSLKLQGCFGLTAEAARVTVHGAPGLVDLTIEAAVTPDLVRDLPASLVSLRLAGVSMGRVVAVGDRPFAGLANLKTLWMAYVEDFTGDGLPASLQNLTVNGCMRFRSTGLNSVPLEALTVMKACPNFDGQGLPASLRRLSLTESYAGEETVYRMIGPLTRLERLDYSRFDGHSGKPDLTRFQGHPALRELHWSRNRFQRQDDGAWR
jgi:hypothetical protein